MSSTGNFSLHIKQIRNKALYAFFNLSRKNLRQLKPNHANTLFDSYISPILTYGSEIWSLYSNLSPLTNGIKMMPRRSICDSGLTANPRILPAEQKWVVFY